ncbi:MAG TPA: FlgD immunoglobulin-like domain containing protein [Candidatus Limnocylindria bacterium]|nr:FlgD immunoglobulin-like domain containing protein [Candidatus Limnocylindria bacterium]
MRLPGPVSLALGGLCLVFAAPSVSSAALPYVTRISTIPEPPCPQQSVTLVIEGEFPDACGRVVDAQGPPVVLTLKPFAQSDTACAAVITPWRREFDLGHFAAGTHSITIEVRVVPRDPSQPVEVHRDRFTFEVRPDCNLPPGPLPHVDTIAIGPLPHCSVVDRLVCPDESIAVCVQGRFPSDCYRLLRVELLPSPILGPRPQPPIVRLIVDDGACLDRPCLIGPIPWRGTATLPPLPPGQYPLMVELAEVTCNGPIDSSRVHRTTARFSVSDSCHLPPQPCLTGTFLHTAPVPRCDAFVSPVHPAIVTFAVTSHAPLAALEGVLALWPPRLVITQIVAVGSAAGMRLTWNPTPEGGARFVLFAPSGAPIPAGTLSPILHVTVEQPGNTPVPRVTYVLATELLGSDAQGNGISECRPGPVAFDPPLEWARICAESRCDLNADGRIDVRDLVLLVRCVNHKGACPEPGSGVGDCNDDSTHTLEDVLCCAARLLRERECPECPSDSGRAEPNVRVAFGTPAFEGGDVRLPVRLSGVERVGGAKLAIAYPADRFDATVELAGVGPEWLALHEMRDGRAVVALIHDGSGDPARGGSEALTLSLRLTPKAGREAQGLVEVEALEVSGRDGVRLILEGDLPQVAFGGAPRLQLGESRPNPFSAETRFTVQLDRPGEVEVAIYDVGGRRMATLHSGWMAAGAHELAWNGRTAEGSEAPGGLYFYRVVSHGEVVARKMVLMRQR